MPDKSEIAQINSLELALIFSGDTGVAGAIEYGHLPCTEIAEQEEVLTQAPLDAIAVGDTLSEADQLKLDSLGVAFLFRAAGGEVKISLVRQSEQPQIENHSMPHYEALAS